MEEEKTLLALPWVPGSMLNTIDHFIYSCCYAVVKEVLRKLRFGAAK